MSQPVDWQAADYGELWMGAWQVASGSAAQSKTVEARKADGTPEPITAAVCDAQRLNGDGTTTSVTGFAAMGVITEGYKVPLVVTPVAAIDGEVYRVDVTFTRAAGGTFVKVVIVEAVA